MPTAISRKQLIERADVVAGKLAARGVGRNQVRQLLDVLARGSGDWQARRLNALDIARSAPNSWLQRRSRGMRDQLLAIQQELSPVLDGRLPEADVYLVLAWTARFLQIREERWLAAKET